MEASRRIRVVIWCALATMLAFPGAVLAAEDNLPTSVYFTLENGLQVLLQEKHDLPLTGLALAIDLGTKDETEQTSGYAHLIEHMLLFGAGSELDSETRLAELRRHGIAHNAHTDHDLMTFEISCPSADSIWALERLRQTVFFSRMDPLHLESEKRIIREEILQLRDNPSYLGRLLVMERLFAGHPYGQPVYGDGSSIQAATVERLQAFCDRRLVPGRCTLSVIGAFSLTEMEKEVRRSWGELEKKHSLEATVLLAEDLKKSSEQQIELDIQESHLFFGWRAPDFNHEHRLALNLLVHILGRGLNPLLNQALRGGRQLAQQFDISYLPLRSGGMILLHLTLREKDIRSAKNEVTRFLRQLGSFNFSREDFRPQNRMYVLDFLRGAKNQMAYGTENFREAVLNMSVASARFLLLNRNPLNGAYLENVEKVSSSDLRRVARKYLSGKKWAALVIKPLAGKKK
ncbi:MAG TPA: pitrilysin family protein [Patescibacteria group bacterium]|nr:pitrilysin family protein [Patescibacteria group bacterium]